MKKENLTQEQKNRIKELNEIEASNIENYDRALVIFLTSTFGFSFLAASYIVSAWGDLCHGWLLLGGWLFLAVAIVLFLVNYYLAYKDVEYRKKENLQGKPYNPKLRKCIIKINFAVGVTYTLSVFLIVAFVVLNMWPLVRV